jgi:hypothetical protein
MRYTARAGRSRLSSLAWGQEKGTGYFLEVFEGRPRLWSVDSSPSVAALMARHSSVPNGCWRFTQARKVVRSCSKSGGSIHVSQSFGTSTGTGSLSCGNRRLDHGQSIACSTSLARTGLRRT